MDDRETGNAVLANLCALNLWANLTLIDTCAELDDIRLDSVAPGEMESPRHALWHLIEREHQFVGALNAEAPASETGLLGAPDGTLGTLRVYAIDSGEALTAWAERVVGDPMLSIAVDERAVDIPASIVVGEALLQAAGQRRRIQAVMQRIGITPPDLSALIWWSMLRAVGSETSTI